MMAKISYHDNYLPKWRNPPEATFAPHVRIGRQAVVSPSLDIPNNSFLLLFSRHFWMEFILPKFLSESCAGICASFTNDAYASNARHLCTRMRSLPEAFYTCFYPAGSIYAVSLLNHWSWPFEPFHWICCVTPYFRDRYTLEQLTALHTGIKSPKPGL